MTEKETNFVNEYVFRFFNSTETDKWIRIEQAAIYAGYTGTKEIPLKKICDDLMKRGDITGEIDSKISAFREKLSGEQRRNLWDAIGKMNISTPCEMNGRIPIRY